MLSIHKLLTGDFIILWGGKNIINGRFSSLESARSRIRQIFTEMINNINERLI